MGRPLIIAKGTYGDIFPMLALARALELRGQAPLLATESRHRAAAESLGLPVHYLDPDPAGGAAGSAAGAGGFLSRRRLRLEVEVLSALAPHSDLVLGPQLAFFGPAVAARAGKPWIHCPLSPLTLDSRLDPCLYPLLERLQRRGADCPHLEPCARAMARSVSRLALAPVLAERQRLAPRDRRHPLFEGLHSPLANLLLASPLLVPPVPDWPPATSVVGFSWFAPTHLGDAASAEALQCFLAAGEPPILFSLAGTERLRPGRFFRTAVAATEALGQRAILVAARRFHRSIPPHPRLLVTGYLPYQLLFQRLAAVVHSGGIGTVGWCLRQGLPSLLLPRSLDQFDNARRAERLGVAQVWRGGRPSAAALAERLAALQADTALRQRLTALAPLVAAEDGAEQAAARISAWL
jgi:UDP:flavonoid glycosyltransferase YjiC (YdhE family)